LAEEVGGEAEVNPVDEFISRAHQTLEQVRKESKEIGLLVEQSQGEVEKLAQRNSSITGHLHQLQANFDTVPREDIRSTYEAAQDAQQRLFTMRGQLEKLESDQEHLQRQDEFIASTLELLEGNPVEAADHSEDGKNTVIEQIIEAQEDERRRISRQIHDGPAQALSNFILQTEIAMRLFDSDQEKAREELSALKDAATSTFGQVRDFIFDLRPMMLDDLGLIPTARRYAEAFQDKTGLDVPVVITGTERRLEAHIEAMVFRSIQALLANVREHAQATQAKVIIDLDDHQIRAAVEDNGRGFAVESVMEDEEKTSGLRSIKDRTEQLGGGMELDSTDGQGTRISLIIPLSS
jgi:two-component system sensor histidine kinase DegS